MINNLFDKKTTEYEFLSVSTELPFKRQDILLGSDPILGTLGNSHAINDIFNHLIDNDLYNEQLILNLSANRNVPGASITGLSNVIIESSQEGQKFVLTSNVEPEVQIVKRIVSDADSNVQYIPELSGRRINFIIDNSIQYIVGTDRGMWCSDDRLSGWRPIEDYDYFQDAFSDYDCRCIIRNDWQGSFNNDLDKYQYFLGTNHGVFALDNSDYFNNTVFWDQIGFNSNSPNLLHVEIVNTLKLDPVEKCLFVGTKGVNAGVWSVHGLSDGSLIVDKEINSNFNANDIEILDSSILRQRNENILVGTDTGFRQSFTKIFPSGVNQISSFEGEKITVLGINETLKYVGTDKNLYSYGSNIEKVFPFDNDESYVYSMDFLNIAENETVELAVVNGKVYHRKTYEEPSLWTLVQAFNGIEDARAVTVLNNRLVAVIVNGNQTQVHYSNFIGNDFRTVHTIDIPYPGGFEIHDAGDNEEKLYVGTEKGANIYQFIESEEKTAFFKLRNNLQNIKIDKIFAVNERLFACSNGNIYVALMTNKFENYMHVLSLGETQEIVDIKYLAELNCYAVQTNTALFKVDCDFILIEEVVCNGSQITASCIVKHNGKNNLLLKSGELVFFCNMGNFNGGDITNKVSCVLSDAGNIQTLYSNNDHTLIDIPFLNTENITAISQFVLTDRYDKNQDEYAVSNGLEINNEPIDKVGETVNSRLKDVDLIDAFAAIGNDYSGLFYLISNIVTDTIDLNVPVPYFDQEYHQTNVAIDTYPETLTYAFTNPYVDIAYLKSELFICHTDTVDVYGMENNYSIDKNQPAFILDNGSNKIVDNDDTTPLKYDQYSDISIVDSGSSWRMYFSDTETPGIIAFAENTGITALKVGLHERNLLDYAINKNAVSIDLETLTGANNYAEMSAHLPDYEFVDNALTGYSGIEVKSSVPINIDHNVIYITTEGLFDLSINQEFFAGIKKSDLEINVTGNIINENGVYYAATTSCILSSLDAEQWNLTRDDLENFSSTRIECLSSTKNITLIDSQQTDVSVHYGSIVPSFVVLIDKKNSTNWNDCYILTYDFAKIFKVSGEDATSELIENSHNGTVKCMAKHVNVYNGASSILIGSYNGTRSSISSLRDISYGDDEMNTLETSLVEVLTGDFEIVDILTDNNGNIFFTDDDGNIMQCSYSNDGTSLEIVNELDLDSIVIDSSTEKNTVYASKMVDNVNSIYRLAPLGSRFEKIFESTILSELRSVHTLQTKDKDIFNNRKLFVYANGTASIVAYSIDKSNESSNKSRIVLDDDFIASKIASFEFEGYDIIAAYGNGTLKVYSTPVEIYNNSISTVLDYDSPYDDNELVDLTIQRMKGSSEPYILALLKSSDNYLMSRMRLFIDNSTVPASIKVDLNPDEYYKYFISAIQMPEEITSLNSFADYFDVTDLNVGEVPTNVYFSTNSGIACLSCTEVHEKYRVFKLDHSGKSPVTGLENSDFIEVDDYLFTLTSLSIKRINKTELSVATQFVMMDKLLGVNGVDNSQIFGCDSSSQAISVQGTVDWENSSELVTEYIDYLQNISTNTMYAGVDEKNILFGADNGLYNLQPYTDMNYLCSYNMLSQFNIDCIEFADNDPIFSMHLICLDLEFDYLSSTIENLTKEYFNRVLAIDRISTDEIVIVQKDAIQIYNIALSQTIDLDLAEFMDTVGGNLQTLSPLGVAANNDAYIVVNNDSLMKFRSWERKRVFGNCIGDYKIFNKKFRDGRYGINVIKTLDDKNFLIATSPKQISNGLIPYSFHYMKDLRMDIALKDNEGNAISSDSFVLDSVVSDISHGYAIKYLFSAGNRLYRTYNKITAENEVSKIPSGRTITSLFAENNSQYLIGTTNGLYATLPEYVLDDEMTKLNVDSVTKMMEDSLCVAIDKHVAEFHKGNNSESEFFLILNEKLSVKPTSMPKGFTSTSDQITYDSVAVISSDIVESMEFNDENKYVRGSVMNWITDLYGGESTYSEAGYVDQMVDPISKSLIDFSDVTYVCKNWNSGMKEFLIYIPTTMTYYINNPKGFTNSKYSGAAIPRKNAKGTTTSNVLTEKCTHYQLVLNNNHFRIKNICMVQIDGNSLPLRIYRDDKYCQEGRENLFDTVMEPSEVNSLPIIPDEDVNNVSYMADSSGYLRINFSIYGTDAQSIRILAN